MDNSESPYVKLRSIGVRDCRWTEGFWADKVKLCEDVMVPHMGTILKGDIGHAYNNFKIAAGLKEGEHKGEWWHDGDFYKWMEAAVYMYALNGDEKILEELDEIIEVIGQAQEDDGYLSTHVTINKFERFDNRQMHELYNAGHLFTGGVIHNRLTGKTNFLDIAIKNADYIYTVFQPRPAKLARFGFNPSQIMGLVELYRLTRDQKYLELAQIFVDMRGANRDYEWNEPEPGVNAAFRGDMCQDRVPIREETQAVGHAVLAMYLYAGVADVYAETGEKALLDALDRIWADVVDKKMYLTGAIGQTHHGSSPRVDFVHEAFITEYMMHNGMAYNETCANIANAMFNWRMMSINSESKHGDFMELALLNSSLSGISTCGKEYFYANPLRMVDGGRDYSHTPTEKPCRLPYIECFCCPPNLVRTIGKASSWAYSIAENGIAVNLYGGNELSTQLQDGSALKLRQETQYPWDGQVRFTVDECKTEPFAVMLRIPGWAHGAQATVNGEAVAEQTTQGQFLTLNRSWKAGDVVELTLPMPVQKIEGHPRIEELRNQIAMTRGPIVYCIESPDLPEKTSILDVYLKASDDFAPEYRPDFLGGVTVLNGTLTLRRDQSEGMYRAVNQTDWSDYSSQLVPYFAWANRGQSEMTVFMPVIWS
ncbi:glycoside hydrolase family 127 protein [Algisphaera agarilytica]|uniref:Non-reducing end beta-L-arabinofuranosidase n=1 Tax=Algisphaera agarilytica TaxID=1385975 RepID=A0A7X0H4L8_9BACT|nr:beta-L-arabinofuranosidase domain-containing protein [Algisphaera agarilytica]MBB6429154.1 hypothetical protein [Algisphaera agarilytica]